MERYSTPLRNSLSGGGVIFFSLNRQEKNHEYKMDPCSRPTCPAHLLHRVQQPGEAVYWFMATLVFKPAEKLKVANSYWQIPDSFNDSMGNYGWSLEYVLETGSSWAGTIKKATLRYHSTDPEIIEPIPTFSFEAVETDETRYSFSYEPKTKVWDKEKRQGTVTWELADIEPSQNLEIRSYGSFGEFPPATLAWGLLGANGLMENRNSVRAFVFMDHGPFTSEYDWARDYARGISREKFLASLDEFYTLAFAPQPVSTQRTKEFARYIVNAIYALHGYRFKDTRWSTVFYAFVWYKPTVDTVIDFTAREKDIINTLTAYR
jgi:hypothetical protein